MSVDETWWWATPNGPEPAEKDPSDPIFHKYRHDGKGPFPTRAMAEEWRWHDTIMGQNLPYEGGSYWDHGMAVYADHCLGCGKYAKVLAGNDEGGGWAWRVTECRHCGILDSRVLSERGARDG